MADKVSVIIVTFNASGLIKHAINSVLDQHYENTELIIVDGNSTDGTADIVKDFNVDTLKWISEPDKGIYDAMNKGIGMATGKWIFFLGADDRFSTNILNEIFNKGEDFNTDLIYGKIKIHGQSKIMGGEADTGSLIEFNIPHQAIFYSKEVLNKFKGYDLRYKILADYDLNLRIFSDVSLQKKFINKEVVIFSSSGVSSRTIDLAFFKDKLRYFIERGLSKNDRRLAKYYHYIGIAQVLQKRYVDGFKNLLHPIIYGGRRLHYLLLTGSFILSLVGIGRRYKYV